MCLKMQKRKRISSTIKYGGTIIALVMLITMMGIGFGPKTEIAYAYSSGSLGNGISWDLNDNGLLTISGTGAIPNYSQGSSPFTSMSSKIKAVNIYYSITSIGDYAFANCSQMTSVSCGGGIKTIGTGAFSNCWSLNSINLPMELNVIKSEAFIYCYGLENVFLPSKLTAVGSDVFMGCDNLGYINFACEKLTVNKYSFRDFGAKTGVKYAGFVAPIDEVAKQLQATGYTTLETTKEYSLGTTSYNIKGILHSNGVLILSGTESMMNYDNNSAIKSPFYNSSNITAVVVDGKIDNIGNGMFQGCSKLTSVTISDKATNIGSNAFRGCSALESVTIANKTRTASDTTAVIGDHAFRDCKNLKSIDISSKIKSIGKYCFSGCSSLQTATFPTYNNGCLIDLGEGAFSDCTSLKKVNLPNTVENVYDNAFSGCIELQEIYFSNAIKSLSPGVLSGCTSLEKAMYLGNAASISKNAFLGCSSLKSISLPLKAMDIGESAFDGCSSLESIIIPKNIESIQANAFRGCSSLKKATLTDAIKKIGVGAFAGCSSLESINIPMKLSAIEANTFDGCSMLKEIFIPQNVSSIGSAAFRNCKKLARIESIYKYEQKIAADSFLDVGTGLTESKVAYFHSKNTKLKSALEKQYTCFSTTASEMLGSNVEAYFYEDGELFIFGTGEIDYDATITNKDTVKSIRFSEGAVNIPEGFFSGCKEITKLTIPSSVKMIDDEAFKNCTSLTSITLPEGIRYLGIDLFANCTSLESVTIPSSVENINSQAFLGCTSLANITIPSKVTGIGMSAFENCTSLANVAILTKETSISDKAFKGCTKLVGITFPSGGTSTSGNYFTIGKEAFMNCESLTSIDIPLGIDSIAQNTFVNCASLTSVTIPSSIGYIEAGTFQNCPSLESFTFDPYTTDVRDNVFVNCPKLETIKVVVLDDTKMPESQRSKSFAGCGTAIKLVLVDQEGVELPESRFRVAYKKFKSASDGDTEDNCWYGTEIYPPYTLTYVVNGTKIVKKYLIEKQEIKLAINDTIAKNIPYRSRFCGWYQAPQFTGEFLTHNDSLTMPANDVVLYARLKNIETPKGLKVTATNADTIIPRNIKFSVEGYEPGKTFYKVLPSGNTILPDVGTVIDTSDKGNWKKVTSKEMTVYVDYDSEYCVQVVTLDDKYDGYPFDQLSVVKGGLCDDVSYRAKLSIGDFKYNLTSVPYTGKGQPINVTSGKVSSKYIHVAYNDIMYSTPEKPGVYEVTIDVDQTYSFCKVEKLYLGKYEILRPAPTELIGYGISAVGETDGKISGLTTEMEYKDKSASEYTKFTGEKGILTGLKPGTYYVRFAADPVKGLSAGVDAEINVKASSKKSAPKGLVGKGISVYGATDGTITGTTEEMEYKLKATDQYEKCTSKAMSQLAAGTYLVRYAATEELDASEPVEVTVDNSKKQLAPKELKGTGVSTLGATDGTITGTTAAMEYKLKTATNYEKCTSKAMSQLAAGTYHVRYAATEELLASEAVEVTVENSKKQQAPKELKGTGVSTLGVTDGTITGTTEAMEYKLKAATKYEKCTSKAMSQLAAGTYLVRYAATEELDASEPVEVTVANSKKQQAPKELKGTGVSTLGATDGTITGTTEAMEYKLKAATQYEKCTSKAMSQLAAGTYLVRYAAKEELVVSEAVEVTVENAIPMTYTVSGTIKDISGNPAPGVTVSLVNIADNNKVYKVATSEQGVYTIANVLDGSYKIIVTKDDKELNTGNVTVSGNNVSGGSCDITVTIAPPTYTIIGTVKMVKVSAATGSAISVSGAAITLSSTTSLMTYAEVTDNNGNYTINGVPDGTYAIAVTINDKVIAAGNIKVNGSNVCDDSTSILVTDPTPDPKPDPKPDPTPDPKPNPTPNPAPGPTGPINVPMNPTPAAPPVLAPKAEPKIVKTEEIKSGVKLGEADSSDVIIPIQRTTDSDGKKKDTAAYKEDTAKETIQKLKEEGKDVARITIPDEKNEISETNVMIPTASLEVIAEGNINLEIATEKARISIPKETLKNADKEAKEDVYFNLAPITSAGEQAQIIERAKQEDIIKVAIKDSIMTVVGTPMTIETNMPQSNVDITLPLATSDIPTDAIEREKFLSKLAVFIEHSDGDMELVRGEIVEYKEGVLGIKFNVKKFSTFTILQADSLAQESSACEIEKVKEPKETIMKGTKLSLTVNNTKTKIKVKVTVSADATWKLYSDVACKKEIKNKYLKLKVGKNKAYIKVFAKDGTSKGYTITVKRKGKE